MGTIKLESGEVVETPVLVTADAAGSLTNRVKLRGPNGGRSRGRKPPASVARETSPIPVARETAKENKQRHGYDVLCVSMYDEDIERIDALVADLKRRGVKFANRSWLLRMAVREMTEQRLDEIVAAAARIGMIR